MNIRFKLTLRGSLGGSFWGSAMEAAQTRLEMECATEDCAGDVVTLSRSGNAADAHPPPRPFGLRRAGPLAALFAPYILPGMLVAHALSAGLGAYSKVRHLFRHRP